MSFFERLFPFGVAGLALCYLASTMVPAKDAPGQMQVREFGRVPVVDRGRIKPIDTLARTSLMVISNRQTFTDEKGESQPAIRWLLDTMTSGKLFAKGTSEQHKVFRIENDQVLDFLGLEARPGSFRYAVSEFSGKMDKLSEAATKAQNLDPKQRDLFHQKILELAQHVSLYADLASLSTPLAVPPPVSTSDEWRPLLAALREQMESGAENLATRTWAQMLVAYADNKPEEFNRTLTAYREKLQQQMPDEVQRADFEAFFNDFAPFYHCSILYVLVFVLCCVGWATFTGPLNRAAFWLAAITLGVQTWALFARMYIQGRPPVTNLYSSAVFIGWGGLALALVLELIYRNGLCTLIAAVFGSLTMLIAHHLAGSGDTLEMMQAVLDTNFWLATHVTCVTLGYTATFVAGFFAIVFILLGLVTPALNRERFKSLSQIIYGVVCFATLLSFTGTVLGGIWADQSWGRFWGWDPKENGALLIVMWNALILHARWAGMVKQRGTAVLAVAGNIITGWSWFGTNQLGVGLHAYGFNNTLAFGLTIFWASQLACIALGLVPVRFWRSFGRADTPVLANERRRGANAPGEGTLGWGQA
jgi:ABC-type transport system involved in cytochrome c biogenesis permease subunit